MNDVALIKDGGIDIEPSSVIVCLMQFMALDRYKNTWVCVCVFGQTFLSNLAQIWSVSHMW